MGAGHSSLEGGPDFLTAADTKDALTNPFNELQVMEGHQDIVRKLCYIDGTRFASAGDDGCILIWDFVQGCHIGTLDGHTLPVRDMVITNGKTLFSASSDRTVRIWNLETFTCEKVLTGHTGAVTCLAQLGDSTIVSGANDRALFVWSADGEMQSRVERQEDEMLRDLLVLPRRIIVTCSANSRLILAYNVSSGRHHTLAADSHREDVYCLCNVNDRYFASGSMDGTVIIWNSESLSQVQELRKSSENYFQANMKHKRLLHPVRHMTMLGQGYLAVTLGKGFAAYDVQTGALILRTINAHESEINSIVAQSSSVGIKLVTCAGDGTVRIWCSSTSKDTKHLPSELSSIQPRKPRFSKETGFVQMDKNPKLAAVCISEIPAHSGEVLLLESLSNSTFVSSGADRSVILWKDGRAERIRRAICAAKYMLQMDQKDCAGYPDDTDKFSDSDLRRVESTGSVYVDASDGCDSHSDAQSSTLKQPQETTIEVGSLGTVPQSSLSPKSKIRRSSVMIGGQHSARVPDYIWEIVEEFLDDGYDAQGIVSTLHTQGLPKSITEAVSRRLAENEM